MLKSQFTPGHKELIFKDIVKKLYSHPKALLRRDKDILLIDNMSINHVLSLENVQTYYNGDWHILTNNNSRDRVVRLDLAPSLHAAMDDLQAEFDALESEELDIIAYLKRILNMAMTLADLAKVTPNCLDSVLPKENLYNGIGHGKLTITKEDLETFKHKNKDAENAVKQRLLINLLLPKI